MSAPAGHNPEVSMLQGGNAAITPMQGGGNIPPGYSGESMLQGGTAPITPLQGGANPGVVVADLQEKLNSLPYSQRKEATETIIEAVRKANEDGLPDKEQIATANRILDSYFTATSDQRIESLLAGKVDALNPGQQRSLRAFLTNLIEQGATDAELGAARDNQLARYAEPEEKGPITPKVTINPSKSGSSPPIPTLARATHNIPVGKKRVAQVRAAKVTAPEPRAQKTVAAEPKRELPIEIYRVSNPIGQAREHEVYTYLRAKEFFLKSQDAEFRNRLITLMNAYQTRRANAWPTLQARAPTLPLAGQPLPKGSSVLQQYSRGIQVLPAETETVIAVSPINGDTNLLIDVLGQLERYNILEVTDGNIVVNGNNVIVFMPPYYAAPITGEKDNRSKNITLLSIFLEIEANNRNKVFVLAEHTATNVNVGEVFYEYRGDRKSKLLVNFMEPTYILDAGEQIILSGAAQGEPALPAPKGVDGYPAWAKPSSADTPNGVVMRSLGETTPFELPANPGQQDGSTGCEYFRGYCEGKGPFALLSQQDKDQLGNTIHAHYVFAIRLGAKNATRICEGAEITDTGEFISPIKFAPTKTEELNAPGAATTPIEFVDKDEPNKTVYYIRQPRIDNGVFEDWNNGRYTADEAAFLNSLDIFPTMLEEIFTGERWQTEVAFFLQSVSVSNCYTDDTLLLRRECEFNRNFLERIYDFFITEDLTVDRRRQIKDLATQDELEKYQEKLKSTLIEDEKTAKTLPKGDGIEPVSRWQFHKNKKAFGTIIVYTIVDKTDTYTAANFMMINKASGLVSYYRIKVPTEQYDADNTIIQTKIQAIKDANSAFFVVY